MIIFEESLKEWNSPLFADVLQQEIKRLSVDDLHLQKALRYGSYASTENLKLIILSVDESDQNILAKVGVFYIGIIAGCDCADDASTTSEQNEYCELDVTINKQTGEVLFELNEQ